MQNIMGSVFQAEGMAGAKVGISLMGGSGPGNTIRMEGENKAKHMLLK
jgi:hypothetical protein